MICNKHWGKMVRFVVLMVGMVSFLFGLLGYLLGRPEGHSPNTLLGMFTGFGFGIMAVAVFFAVRERITPKEKLQQEEIERWDERNIAISRAAGTTAFYTAFALFAILVFVFMGLDYAVPAYVCMGALYLLAAVFVIARKVLEQKM